MKLLAFTFAILQLSGSVLAAPTSEFNDIQARADWEDITPLKTTTVTSRTEWETQAKNLDCRATTQVRKSWGGLRDSKYRIKLHCTKLEKGQIVKATLMGQIDSKPAIVEVASVEMKGKRQHKTETSSDVRLEKAPKSIEMKLSVVH